MLFCSFLGRQTLSLPPSISLGKLFGRLSALILIFFPCSHFNFLICFCFPITFFFSFCFFFPDYNGLRLRSMLIFLSLSNSFILFGVYFFVRFVFSRVFLFLPVLIIRFLFSHSLTKLQPFDWIWFNQWPIVFFFLFFFILVLILINAYFLSEYCSFFVHLLHEAFFSLFVLQCFINLIHYLC